MNINFKNNLIVILSFIFLLALVLLNCRNSFFWDTVQLGSKHANFYFSTNFSHLFLPDNIDSGHIPAFGMYIAFVWKLFGRSLLTSHLAMLPFVLGIGLQLFRVIQKFTINKYWGFALILVLIDPSLLSQMTLVSPDIPLVFFFLLAVNSVLNKRRLMILISVIFLFLTSLRGITLSLCILCLDLYCNTPFTGNVKKIIVTLLRKSLIYLPALLFFVLYSLFHYQKKGWFGFHENSPWIDSFKTVDVVGFIFNIGILGWRIIDFGRIGIWIVFIILLIIYKERILKNHKTRLLLFFFICTLILLAANMLWAKNLLGHRYLIPVYLTFSLLCVNILFSTYVKEKLRYGLMAVWIIIIVTGNFWIYPSKISQGWDSTLAHLPYYNLRLNAMEYINSEGIDYKQVASFFPNISTLDEIDLNGGQIHFSEYDGDNKYIFYSNVFNINDNAYDKIIYEYNIIKRFKKNGIYIWICKKRE